METRSRLRRKTTTGAPAATDLRPWELCWNSVDVKLYIGIGDTDGHATSVQQISGAGVSVAWSDITGKPAYATRWPSWSEVTSKPTFGSMAYINDAPIDSTGYVRKDGAWAVESGGSDPQANLYDNPSGQLGAEDFELSGNITVTSALDEEQASYLANTTGSGTKFFDLKIPVDAGVVYSLSFDTNRAGEDGTYTFSWFNSSKAYISGFGSPEIVSSSTWSRVKVDGVTSVAGAAYLNIRMVRYGSAVGDKVWLRRIKLERSPVVTDFNEDALVDTKVSAEQVRNIVVTSTTPTSNAANSGKLYLVY